MNNITNLLNDIYHPVKAMVIYECHGKSQFYVESYDMHKTGKPINPHPLSVNESNALSEALDASTENRQRFLMSSGFLPKNVLYINTTRNGFAIWQTPPMQVNLFFNSDLGIDDGLCHLPSMIWKATNRELYVWAIEGKFKANMDLPLCNAPFFNMYPDGKVCMGNVEIEIGADCGLEEFMDLWQSAFFKSKFSHLIQKQSPVKMNIVQLWQQLSGTAIPFPKETLITTNKKFKDLLI